MGSTAYGWVYGFQGMRYDTITMLNKADFRWYSAALERWTAMDPLGFGGGSNDLYKFGGNDPEILRDPSGLAAIKSQNDPGTAAPESIDLGNGLIYQGFSGVGFTSGYRGFLNNYGKIPNPPKTGGVRFTVTSSKKCDTSCLHWIQFLSIQAFAGNKSMPFSYKGGVNANEMTTDVEYLDKWVVNIPRQQGGTQTEVDAFQGEIDPNLKTPWYEGDGLGGAYQRTSQSLSAYDAPGILPVGLTNAFLQKNGVNTGKIVFTFNTYLVDTCSKGGMKVLLKQPWTFTMNLTLNGATTASTAILRPVVGAGAGLTTTEMGILMDNF